MHNGHNAMTIARWPSFLTVHDTRSSCAQCRSRSTLSIHFLRPVELITYNNSLSASKIQDGSKLKEYYKKMNSFLTLSVYTWTVSLSFSMTATVFVVIENTCLIHTVVNPFPNKPLFWRVCRNSLLKTLWRKEKFLVTSNFSFSQCFLPFWDLAAIFLQLKIIICKLSQFGRV